MGKSMKDILEGVEGNEEFDSYKYKENLEKFLKLEFKQEAEKMITKMKNSISKFKSNNHLSDSQVKEVVDDILGSLDDSLEDDLSLSNIKLYEITLWHLFHK